MPKTNKYYFDVGFSQQKYIFELSEKRFKHIIDKFISYDDPGLAKEITGICLALSAAYLTQVREGGLEQGERYLKGIKRLVKVIESHTESYDPPYIKARHQARQLHAKEKLNLLFIDLVSRQRLSFDLYEMMNYQPDYSNWPAIEKNETIPDFIKKVVDFETKKNYKFIERFWFKTLMLEIEHGIDTHKVNVDDIKLTVHRIFLDFKKKYIKGYVNYYNERGLKINNQDINSIANDIEFDVFITNYLDKDSTVNRRYFELSSENHMMAIVIEKNSQTELVKYAFFDPNYGVIYFDDKEKFKQFLTYIIKERKDIYNFLVYDNNTYITSIIELENDPVINKNNIFPIIESDLVNITTTKILCDEQSFFYLSDNQKLQFKKFHQQSASTELELISDGEQYKAISIVINSVDSKDILALITNQYKNILKFNYDKIYLKIENDKCIVYKINQNVKLLANQPLPISALSEPITEFTLETLPVESLEIHKNEVLGQDTVKLDQWWDPRVEPEKIPSHSSAVKTKLAESNYRHNLIIQLEGENIVSQSTANLIGKHPDNTTVIQYDLEQNRYRVVYGDINKVAGERTRWFLIGHGRKDDITKKRTFARKTAEYIADKLMHLRKTEFNNSEPEKIVLLGCKLGQAKIGDNFALDFSQQLWNEGFNSTITAYTRDLYIGSHGRKNIYLNDFERSRRDARYYKTTFDKQLSPLGIQINNEILIFYILRSINLGELSLDSEVIKNNNYIKQYFHLPNGKLDIDLLKLVAYDARAYGLFYQYVDENRHNYTIDGFLNKLWAEKIFDPPLWKTINQAVIKQNLYSVKQNNVKKIIFRFSDKQKYCQQAELLASENPNDSFIFQVDKNSNKIFLEYGDLNKLKNSVIDKWMIVGEIELHNNFLLFEKMTVEKLVDIMDNIHKQNFLAIPDEICFFSKKALGTLSSPYDTSGIASEFSIKLAERNINAAITTYQVNPDLFSTRSLDGVNEYFDLVKNNNQLTKFRYDKTTKQLFYNELDTAYALFFDIMKGNINIEKDLDQYQFYLNNYLYDNKGKLITKRIENIKYDPIINRKVNNYFNSKMEQQPDALVKWEEIFTNNNEMLNVKAHHLSLLLENIYYRPEIINHLSDYSNQLLSEIYSYSDGSPDIGRLMLLVNDQPRLNQLRTSLIELSAIDNRSGLYTLPLSVALSKSQKWHNYYLNNILLLTKITNNNANIIIKPMPHAFYLEKRANLEKCIGIFYASLSSKVDNVDDILQYHHRLLESSATRRLSIDEQLFLDKLNQAVDWAAYLVVNENGLTEQANIILPENLTLAPITQYQLSINNVTFTLIVKYKGNASYQCRIFDPRMGEIVINNIAKEKINEEVISFLTNYLNQDVTVFDTVYKRYEIFDINKDIALSGQFKVHKIHENDIIKIKVNDLIEFLPVKENLTDFYKNVTIAEQNIGLFALKRAGAHINENLISPFMIRNIPDWQSKLKFDIEQLNDYLTFSQGTEENISIIKLLKEKINSSENYRDFLFNRGDLHDVATIYQRLAAIDQYVDANTVDGELWHNLQQGMTRLPRYAHIVNKLSNATQLANIIQLISSTQSALIYLNDPQVSIQERQDIEKNLIIAWGAGITNFGTELLQPILLKLAYQMTGSIDTASRFAVRMSLGINIASSGFDLYYAYQNFDQLQDEINPAKRQDLIVNGTLSLLSAGINISSALAILAGVSSAGPIGLFLGTGLMISNSFYNAYRTVEEIEEKVALTTSEEWETGFRAILGLQPDYSVRNKLLKQQTYSEIKEYKIEKEKKLFTELLKPSGYNLSIVVDEDEQVSELPLYHLFDKKTNLYLFKNKNKNVQYDLEALKHNFNILTLPINLWKQQQIDNIIEINKRKFTAEEIKKIFHQYPDRYEVEADKIKTYIPLQSIATNEIILLNREYDNLIKRITNKPFLDNYLFRQANAIYSLPGNGQPEYIFESLDSYFMKGVLRKYITGSNFNLGDGDDIAVGLSLAKNRFVSYSGRKIFIGGEQDDVFILAGNKLGYGEDKYFNGKGGNDTIIVEHLPRYHSNMLSNGEAGLSNALLSLTGTFINLQQGTVRFLYEDYLDNFENISSFNNSHYISDVHVDLVSFEHVIGIKDKQDIILGNRKNNILNGNGGIDIIYGMAGEDTIILNNGYANGGEEQDTYVIERYNPHEYKKNLLWNQSHYLWDADNQEWNYIDEDKKEFNVVVTIDEQQFKDKSIVNLNYKLDEIKNLKLVGNDIHIHFSIVDSQFTTDKDNNIKLILKNAYKNMDNEGLIVNHEYILQTIDGFLLSMDPSQKIKKQGQPEKIFNVMYFEKLDKQKTSAPCTSIEINLSNNSITNFRKNYILSEMIKPLLKTYNAQYTILNGDRFDNQFLSIKNNTYIYISHGVDFYIISDLDVENIENNKDIIFDFNKIIDGYTNEDIVIIVIKNYSGYDFIFCDNRLKYSKSENKSEIEFINNSINFYGKIYLVDKNNEYFNITFSNNQYSITPVLKEYIGTGNNDNITYTKNSHHHNVIRMLSGNDIVTDTSELGNIIFGDDGDDIITAKGGSNIVVDGNGNDIISTGDGNDIIISTKGNNIIDAGKGDNVIVINYTSYNIKVYLNEGNNKIFLQGMDNAYSQEYKNDNLILSSVESERKITIYNYNKYKDNLEINTLLNNGLVLDDAKINLLVNAASAFKQNDYELYSTMLTTNEKYLINQIYQYSGIRKK